MYSESRPLASKLFKRMFDHHSPPSQNTTRYCEPVSLPYVAKPNQVSLPSWPHSRDTLTVWKRHSFCAIQYGDDSDEDGSGDDHEAAPQREGDIEGHEYNGTSSSPDGRHGVFASANTSKRGAAGRADEASEGGGEDGSDDRDDDEAESHLSGSDDTGSVEGLPVGMPDVDMYAFVPADEQMPYEQAAPCVRFLLDE